MGTKAGDHTPLANGEKAVINEDPIETAEKLNGKKSKPETPRGNIKTHTLPRFAKLLEIGSHKTGTRAKDSLVGTGIPIPHSFINDTTRGPGYGTREEEIGETTNAKSGSTAKVDATLREKGEAGKFGKSNGRTGHEITGITKINR